MSFKNCIFIFPYLFHITGKILCIFIIHTMYLLLTSGLSICNYFKLRHLQSLSHPKESDSLKIWSAYYIFASQGKWIIIQSSDTLCACKKRRYSYVRFSYVLFPCGEHEVFFDPVLHFKHLAINSHNLNEYIKHKYSLAMSRQTKLLSININLNRNFK
jgi:hypothetical protein